MTVKDIIGSVVVAAGLFVGLLSYFDILVK